MICGLAGVALCVFLATRALLSALLDSRHGPPQQMMNAAMAGDLDRLQEMEARGVSLNYQDRKTFGWTPLIAAIFHRNTNIIDYLLTRNLNPDARDHNGMTALMWAIEADDTNTVRLLLERGADVDIRNRFGFNAFGYLGAEPKRDDDPVIREWLNAHKRRKD